MGSVARPPLSRRRHILVWTLIVVAALIGLVASLTTWVKREMLDTTGWNKATTQVIQSPEVRSSLSTYLVNQIYNNVDVAQSIGQRLPPNLKPVAGPLATALRQPATNAASALLARPRVQQLWISTTTLAHEKLVNVLENKTGFGVTTGNGEVVVDLHTLVTEIGTEMGLSPAALEKIPTDAGQVTLLKSDQLSAAQTGVQALRVLSAWLLVLVFALFALAVYLAHGARRAALRGVGWALVVVGLILLIVRRVVGNYVLDAIASPTYRGSAHAVWLIGTAILGEIAVAAIIYGVIALLGTTLAGPTRAATALRHRIAPVLNDQVGHVAAGVGVVYLLVVLWGPTHALRTWWGILLFAGLITLGVWQFRRQTLAEAATGERLSQLETLHEQGALSDDEFDAAKLAIS
jgi:hypothetical protein